jgi:hypothetical protein
MLAGSALGFDAEGAIIRRDHVTCEQGVLTRLCHVLTPNFRHLVIRSD